MKTGLSLQSAKLSPALYLSQQGVLGRRQCVRSLIVSLVVGIVDGRVEAGGLLLALLGGLSRA